MRKAIYFCPFRARGYTHTKPRALPWAMELLGFQPALARYQKTGCQPGLWSCWAFSPHLHDTKKQGASLGYGVVGLSARTCTIPKNRVPAWAMELLGFQPALARYQKTGCQPGLWSCWAFSPHLHDTKKQGASLGYGVVGLQPALVRYKEKQGARLGYGVVGLSARTCTNLRKSFFNVILMLVRR